jgi:hypothetical protein
VNAAAVEISESLQRGIDDLIGFLPRLIGFLLILLIGYLVAKALAKVVTLALEKLGTDRALSSGTTGEYVEKIAPDISPSNLIGRVVFWFIMLGVLSIAISALGIAALNEVAAILIGVIAVAIAGAVARLVTSALGGTPLGKLLATALPALVIAIAVFMILNQLRIATEIVTITYAAVLGALALGMALAFGLGGRDVASRMLEDAYQRGREERARIRSERAPAPATHAKTYAPHDTGGRPTGA